jgi:hypothetical protein
MVKNVTGGSKHRSAARKQTVPAAPPVVQWVRRAEKGELYASAAKNYGGCRFGVLCSDGKERICVIRRKFKKYRRGNDVSVGTYMLVGPREWETDSNTCDLLCVYSAGEVKLLMQDAAFKYEMLCVNEKKIEEVREKVKHAESVSGRTKAPVRFIEDIMFDEDVVESGSEEEEEADESEPLVAEQTKFSNVDKSNKKGESSYDISAYLDGIDEGESETESDGGGEKDEFGNYL